MSHRQLYWRTAARVCTNAELQALTLKHQRGLGYYRIGLTLDISRSAARDRIRTAEQKIAAALTKETAA